MSNLPMVRTWYHGMIPFKDFPQEIHPERLWVLKQLGDPAGRRILDIGCGTHKTLPECTGVDVRPVTDYQASMDDLPFPPEEFDVIISRHSFEHVLNPVLALREWRRVIKPEGRVIIVIPDHGQVDTMQEALSAGQHLHAYTMESFLDLVHYGRQFTISSLEVVLEQWSFGAVLTP
jgi:ubiquinone/menaquinone biosynthesis C-methylase UbiE